jgi:dTDP-4-amino-4,6-dideoxy-D-glucose acyltransferase
MGYLSRDEISALGFAAVGDNVQLSTKASFYNCASIAIGSNVRIDDFCVLSAGEAGIALGSYIHVALYTSLVGAGRIVVSDFCNLSSRVSIFSSSDDYSGATMTNPLIPEEFKAVKHAPVTLGKHTIIGCGSIVLPGVTTEEAVAIGALSLVSADCTAFGVYAGVPAKRVNERKRDLLAIEAEFRKRQHAS